MTNPTPKSSRESISLKELKVMPSKELGVSDWIAIDQRMIDDFARITGDDAFIHIDPDRAATTRFGGTIAHGLLLLSLLPLCMRTATPLITGTRMSVNYGYDRIRFLTPVAVNSRVRARFELNDVKERDPGFFLIEYNIRLEIEGIEKPALVASWSLGIWQRKLKPDP